MDELALKNFSLRILSKNSLEPFVTEGQPYAHAHSDEVKFICQLYERYKLCITF